MEISAKFENSLGMEFVLIQSGIFLMGSPENEKERSVNEVQHQVRLPQAFYLQATPVTQGQWELLLGYNPAYFKGDPNLPVENLSWDDCQGYIQQLNQREEGVYCLPSEAQWEYACRAGTQGPFGIGNGDDLDSSLANFDGTYPYGQGKVGEYRYRTTPVRQFSPNAWGLYDMHGNVWEWCEDWCGVDQWGALIDSHGFKEGSHRILRGGSWYAFGQHLRSAYRHYLLPERRDYDLGFRLLRLL